MSQNTACMAVPTYAYHPDVPEGRIFDLDNPDHVEELETGGWVDSPAKMAEAEKPAPTAKASKVKAKPAKADGE